VDWISTPRAGADDPRVFVHQVRGLVEFGLAHFADDISLKHLINQITVLSAACLGTHGWRVPTNKPSDLTLQSVRDRVLSRLRNEMAWFNFKTWLFNLGQVRGDEARRWQRALGTTGRRVATLVRPLPNVLPRRRPGPLDRRRMASSPGKPQ
jgi:hypothetical protein